MKHPRIKKISSDAKNLRKLEPQPDIEQTKPLFQELERNQEVHFSSKMGTEMKPGIEILRIGNRNKNEKRNQ